MVYYKFLVDTGLYVIKASLTADLLNYTIKGRCICSVD